jgi:hypothetical protein
MSSTPTIPPLTGTITMDAPIDRVFRTFTDAFGSWWPAEYHIGQADMATAILERARAAAGMSGAWTAASATGAGCWPGNHRSGWS